MYYNSDDTLVDFYVQGKRGLSIMYENSNGGGNLHGVWYSDYIVHTSDRRLKKNIHPIMESLDARAAEKGATEDSARWVLRELRPVSYQFKRGPESKLQRFGFIADDVQATIPQVVRENPTKNKIKGILYEDLLAVLAAVLQSMQRQLEGSDLDAQETRHRLDGLEARLLRVERAIERQVESRDSTVESLKEGLRAIEAMIEQRLPDPGASSRLRTTWQDGGAHGFGRAAATTTERLRSWASDGSWQQEREVVV